MHGIYTVAEVRTAEGVVLDRTADGELMLRAAAGLARRCAQLLTLHRGGVYGARVVLLCGTGNNGGDALFAGVSSPSVEPRCTWSRPARACMTTVSRL